LEPITLKQVVDCFGAIVRNDELQPASDPILTLNLKAQDGQIYLVPLSERGAAELLVTILNWRQTRDYLSEQKSPGPTKRQ
jgi:hypothetical protein